MLTHLSWIKTWLLGLLLYTQHNHRLLWYTRYVVFFKSLPWLGIEIYVSKISLSFYRNIVHKNGLREISIFTKHSFEFRKTFGFQKHKNYTNYSRSQSMLSLWANTCGYMMRWWWWDPVWRVCRCRGISSCPQAAAPRWLPSSNTIPCWWRLRQWSWNTNCISWSLILVWNLWSWCFILLS